MGSWIGPQKLWYGLLFVGAFYTYPLPSQPTLAELKDNHMITYHRFEDGEIAPSHILEKQLEADFGVDVDYYTRNTDILPFWNGGTFGGYFEALEQIIKVDFQCDPGLQERFLDSFGKDSLFLLGTSLHTYPEIYDLHFQVDDSTVHVWSNKKF
jgi:hypothetical protein